MKTIDQLLLRIVNHTRPTIEEQIVSRDAKVLRSLATSILSQKFITENQSKLLVKILKENSEKIQDFTEDILEAIVEPSWSKTFRQIDQTKKLYISQSTEGVDLLSIELAFNSQIRKLLAGYSKKITGFVQNLNGKLYYAELTEKNIITLVDLLLPHDFDVDQKIMDFYNTIKSWSENEVRGQFLITTITHPNFQRQITADLGLETAIDKNIIADRRIRYQYFVEDIKNPPENLTEIIATRSSNRLWIDQTTCKLEDIFASLISLKRLPTLVIFDTYDAKKCSEDLKILSNSLEENGIFDQVGIYFRLPNSEAGIEFNKFIADKHYNCQLDQSTKIVAVQNGKIPKFFLKSDWKPMSVIAIGSSLKQTKTAVYANCCDLVISYTDSQPIIETRTLWE
jgi:hypothetical protein